MGSAKNNPATAEVSRHDETPELPPHSTHGGMRKLVHELEVHQIELETQNVELGRARDEVETALGVLKKTGWRIEGQNGAAGILGINASTLRARMRKYGIVRR